MPGGYQNLAGRVGAGHEVFEVSRDGTGRDGLGRVGSGGVQIPWVGSGYHCRLDLIRKDPFKKKMTICATYLPSLRPRRRKPSDVKRRCLDRAADRRIRSCRRNANERF